ncbi:ras-related protein rab-5c [Anaeramoeba flamelloides]|uniref:Ras-related protein rab-5c n=1 Tax=Anaeramoeba flamelloides TaxID=1746091 RepID=A0AAV7Y0M1_9EUKA|nr:ras-related protein rab-5c [Anaeramoeba flamelloides]
MSQKFHTLSFKIVVLGESAVGKTSILLRFYRNKYTAEIEPTIGATNFQKIINVGDYKIQLLIWDTAGQERYHSLAQMYYRGAKGALVVYDVTNNDSFEKAKEWVEEIKNEGSPNAKIALVGNKIDLPNHTVDKNEAKKYAKENNLFFFQTSAKMGEGINNAFVSLAKSLPLEFGETINPNIKDLNSNEEEKKKEEENNGGCC